MKTFEVTGMGFDGADDTTDDRVFWVKAGSDQEIAQAIEGTNAGFHQIFDAQTDIDFSLPAQADLLRSRLMTFKTETQAITKATTEPVIERLWCSEKPDGTYALGLGDEEVGVVKDGIVAKAIVAQCRQPKVPNDKLVDASFQAMYMMIGAEHALKRSPKEDIRESHLVLAEDLANFAPLVADFVRRHAGDDGWPGVFEFEVTEELGAWCFHHPNARPEEFQAAMDAEFEKFMVNGVSAPAAEISANPAAPVVATQDLQGPLLVYFVNEIEGFTPKVAMNSYGITVLMNGVSYLDGAQETLALLDREEILCGPSPFPGGEYAAGVGSEWSVCNHIQVGNSRMEAALRCFVASRLGLEVSMPQAFIDAQAEPMVDPDASSEQYLVSVYSTRWDHDALEAGQSDDLSTEVDQELWDADDFVSIGKRRYGLDSTTAEIGNESRVFVYFRSSYHAEDRDYFEKGVHTYYTLHIHEANGKAPTDDDYSAVAKLLEIKVPVPTCTASRDNSPSP